MDWFFWIVLTALVSFCVWIIYKVVKNRGE